MEITMVVSFKIKRRSNIMKVTNVLEAVQVLEKWFESTDVGRRPCQLLCSKSEVKINRN